MRGRVADHGSEQRDRGLARAEDESGPRAGVDRMRRLVCEYYDGFSFGNFMKHHPELRGTVTDLLIGDLFNDRVDKVWKPMESLYPPGKASLTTWDGGMRADAVPEKANELNVPEGWKP